MFRKGIAGIAGFAFIVIVIGSYVIVAQTQITGTWTSQPSDERAGKIQLNFERDRSANGGRNQTGSQFDVADLQGLDSRSMQNGPAKFSLVREAGTIECEGTFVNGKGSGTYRFTPSAGFADAMKSRGFDLSSSKHGEHTPEETQFAAAMLNVTTALADQLLSANFGPLQLDDLFKAAIFKITPEFMSEMKATGYPNLKFDDLVKARIFKIDAAYVREMNAIGFANTDFEGLVKFRIFKVTPEFVNELKAEGFADISSEEIVKMRIFKIDGQFIRQAKTENPNISVEGLVRKKIGVGR